jgi:hypothetical protein
VKKSFVFTLALFCTTAAHAQVVRGVVLDVNNRNPIPSATIEVLGERDSVPLRAASDSAGAFSISLPRAGNFTIQAKRIGFLVATPAPFHIDANQTITVEMRLDSRAVPLQPVAVTARGNEWLADFERRRSGAFGRFITRQDIEERGAEQTTGLFRMMPGFVIQRARRGGPGSQLLMRGTAGLCQPTVWIDNVIVPLTETMTIDDVLTPQQIEGAEIYNSVAAAPTQYRVGTCGVIVFWTRRGSGEGGKPFRWKEILIGATVGLVLISYIIAR